MFSPTIPVEDLMIRDDDTLPNEVPYITSDSDSSDEEDMSYQQMQAIIETTQEFDQTAPKNTRKAYDPKIREFKNWCDRKYTTLSTDQRYTVTGPKLHLFLKKEVYTFLVKYIVTNMLY